MLEFIIFWAIIAVLCAGLIYVSYEHYKICNIRRKVDRDWAHMSDTINDMEEKLKDLHDKIIDSENRLEEIRREQITIKRETDEVSFSIQQTLEYGLNKKDSTAISIFKKDNQVKVNAKKKKQINK